MACKVLIKINGTAEQALGFQEYLLNNAPPTARITDAFVLPIARYVEEIHRTTTRPWTTMEVCGGQTHSLVKNGLLQMLPDQVRMVHGPGCPVCVTPLNQTDTAIYLAEAQGAILCSYGDMLRVANEGVLIAIVAADAAESVLEVLQADPNGQVAAIIGTVTGEHPRQVVLHSKIGGKRVVNMPVGEQLPRIC